MEKIKKYFTEHKVVLLEYDNPTEHVQVQMPIDETLKYILIEKDFTVVDFWDIGVPKVSELINAFKFHDVCDIGFINDIVTNIMNDEYQNLNELIEVLEMYSDNKYLNIDECLLEVKKLNNQKYDSIHIVSGNKLKGDEFEWLIMLLLDKGKLAEENINDFYNGDIKLCVTLKGKDISYNCLEDIEEIEVFEFDFNDGNLDKFLEMSSFSELLTIFGLGVFN